jgi:hypothetical protein
VSERKGKAEWVRNPPRRGQRTTASAPTLPTTARSGITLSCRKGVEAPLGHVEAAPVEMAANRLCTVCYPDAESWACRRAKSGEVDASVPIAVRQCAFCLARCEELPPADERQFSEPFRKGEGGAGC